MPPKQPSAGGATSSKGTQGPRHHSGKHSKAASGPTAAQQAQPAQPAKKVRSRPKKKQSKSGAAGGAGGPGGKEDDAGKQRLKVVVRRLPPNLPEDIFWKSVEPWTGKQLVDKPAPILVKQTAAAEDAPTRVGQETDDGEQHEATKDSSDDAANPANAAAEAKSAAPPIVKPGPYIHLGVPAQEKLVWRRYVQGKFKTPPNAASSSSQSSLPHVHSRAYLRFRSLTDLLDFHRNFDGHVFRDSKGRESVALVEWAPYQKVPPLASVAGGQTQVRRRPDKREGTIHEEPDFLAFVERLEKGGKEEASEERKDTKSDAEVMAFLSAATSAKGKETADSAAGDKKKLTPLLEHLKAKKAQSAAAAAAAAQAKAASKKQKGKGAAGPAGKGAATSGKKGAASSKQTDAQVEAVRAHMKASIGGPASPSAPDTSSPKPPTGPANRKGKSKELKPSAAAHHAKKGTSTPPTSSTAAGGPPSSSASTTSIPTGPKAQQQQQKNRAAKWKAKGKDKEKGTQEEAAGGAGGAAGGKKGSQQQQGKGNRPKPGSDHAGGGAPAAAASAPTPTLLRRPD
ncbi:hypothetical protein BDZ90DRAFT_231327 [Jaminaea rosea]|uniref:UPF3 domain-containing protein n=1 Tax=Jaminaea rosea TaxID=1569628 RepID=A0A316UVI5_9BASI|nr:hypothetical protein BDZ90DRAFT_231327 [Jaminaea rosea]PWN28341.1 hypothetical protein BDZ90DRAFT_231327 [Jaminaea rosea]